MTPRGPQPAYLAEVKRWPEDLRQLLERKAKAWAAHYGCPLVEAEAQCFARLMMGRYKLPPVAVDAGPDGDAPAWANRLPTRVTVRYGS